MNKNYKKVKLSSKWTTIGYYGTIGGLLFSVLFNIFVITLLFSGIKTNLVLALVIGLVLFFGTIYIIKNLAIGEIKDNVIYLKKFSKPEMKYELKHVEDIKMYENLRDKYVLLKMKNGSQQENYLLVSSKAFYVGEVINADIVLNDIAEHNKSKKI